MATEASFYKHQHRRPHSNVLHGEFEYPIVAGRREKDGPVTKWVPKKSKGGQYSFKKFSKHIVNIASGQTLPATSRTGFGIFEIPSSLKTLEDVYCEVNVTASTSGTGTSPTLCFPMCMEFSFESGSTVLSQVPNRFNTIMNCITLTQDEFGVSCDSMGMSTSYGPKALTLDTATSGKFKISHAINYMELTPAAMNQKQFIRYRFCPVTESAGDGYTYTVNSVYFHFTELIEPTEVYEARVKAIRSSIPTRRNCFECIIHDEFSPSGTTEYLTQLTNIHGFSPMILLQGRDKSAAVNTNFDTGIGTLGATKVNLLNQSNQPIFIEYDNITGTEIISMFMDQIQDSGKYFTTKKMIPLVFTNSRLNKVLNTGYFSSFMCFDGLDRLKFKSDSSDCDNLTIYLFKGKVVTFENGIVSKIEDM